MPNQPSPPMDDQEMDVQSLVTTAVKNLTAPSASGESAAAYEDLLAALRKDLQLDATIDVLPGTVALAMLNDAGRATSATTGAASALPADPAGYLVFRDAKNITYKVPFYNL